MSDEPISHAALLHRVRLASSAAVQLALELGIDNARDYGALEELINAIATRVRTVVRQGRDAVAECNDRLRLKPPTPLSADIIVLATQVLDRIASGAISEAHGTRVLTVLFGIPPLEAEALATGVRGKERAG